MVAGPGGRRLRGRLPQGKSPSLEAAGFRQQDTQMGSLPFSISIGIKALRDSFQNTRSAT